MVSSITIETLNTILIVDDNSLPDSIFAIKKCSEEPELSRYVKIDSLPEEIQKSIRRCK